MATARPPRRPLPALASLLVVVVIGTGSFVVATSPPAGAPVAEPTPAEKAVEPVPVLASPTAPPPEAGPTTSAAPSQPAAPAAPPSPVATAAPLTLDERLAAVLAQPDTAVPATLAITIVDDQGTTVFDDHGDRALLPASTTKLVTAAAALVSLGPDYRYLTTLQATGPIGPDGTLDGHLVLVGSGDPALATPTFGGIVPDRPRTPLEGLADQLVAGGLRRVTGQLLGDPSVFADEPVAPGWREDYLEDLDTTLVSGLTAEAGRRLFVEDGRLRSAAAPDPATEAAASLLVLLRDRGVEVTGGHAATRTPPPTPVTLAAVQSPPLVDLLRHTVQRSDNHMADAIFRTIGAAAGTPTWTGSGEATYEALRPMGLDWSGAVLADGSGLSRAARLSTRFLVGLDLGMSRSSVGEQWASLQAVAGEVGTLQRRLDATAADGRLRGKTGSLRDVRSLVAAIAGSGDARYHFAVIANDLDRDDHGAIRLLQDRIGLVLTEALWGCSTPLPPPPLLPAPPAPAAGPAPATPAAPATPPPPAPEPPPSFACAA